MWLANTLTRLRERLPLLRRILFGVLALLVVLDVFIHRHHVYFVWDEIPGFSAALGFVACLILLRGAMALGHGWLTKPADYYDRIPLFDDKPFQPAPGEGEGHHHESSEHGKGQEGHHV